MSRFMFIAGILALGVLAAPNARAADALPGVNSPTGLGSETFTFGVYSVTIYSCNETSNGTTVSGDCANEQVVGTVTNNGSLALTYQSLAGSSLLSTTVGGANLDISLTETITTTSKLINGVSLGLTGAVQTPSNVFEQDDVAASEADNTAGQVIVLNTKLGGGNGSSPYTVAQSIATPTNSITLSKDMAASSLGALTGNTIALNTVQQVFNVPEPASLSVLAAGFGALIGLRRRQRARTTA